MRIKMMATESSLSTFSNLTKVKRPKTNLIKAHLNWVFKNSSSYFLMRNRIHESSLLSSMPMISKMQLNS